MDTIIEPVTQLCACGCGEPTKIATKTDKRYGHVKGQPMRYLPGHFKPTAAPAVAEELAVDGSVARTAEWDGNGYQYTEGQPAAPAVQRDAVVWLKPDEIVVTGNVRKRFDEAKLAELATSIKEMGLLEPLLVRIDVPDDVSGDMAADLERVTYQLVAGERRLRASKMAGLDRVPCVVKRISPAEAAKVQLLENLQRADLDPIEEAEAYQALIDVHGIRQRELAQQLGVSESHISNRRRLLRLPESVREDISHEKLSHSVAANLIQLDLPPALAADVVDVLVKEQVTQADAPRRIARALEDSCAVVGPRHNWNLKTCDPDCHLDCPCRRKVEGTYESFAVCVDPERFAAVEGEAKAAIEAKAEQAKAAATSGDGVVDLKQLPGSSYGRDRSYERLETKDVCQRHAACACRRDATSHGGEPCQICVDPKAYDRIERAAKRQESKQLKAAIAAQDQQVADWMTERLMYTWPDDEALPIVRPIELRYLAAMVIEHYNADMSGPNGTRRTSKVAYFKQFGITVEEQTPTYRNRDVWRQLEHADPRVLWRIVFEWPLLAKGPDSTHALGAWYRREVDGEEHPLASWEQPEDEPAAAAAGEGER